jgi:hypothetical protein
MEGKMARWQDGKMARWQFRTFSPFIKGGRGDFLLFICLLLIATSNVWGDNYTGDFLTVGVGARSMGLGGAYVGISNDVTATYWNPAGLGLIKGVQICLMHGAGSSGLGSYNYMGVAHRFQEHFSVGASWIRYGVDGIPLYDALDINIQPQDRKNVARFRPSFEPKGQLSDSENAYIISMSTQYTIRQSWWDNMGTMGEPPTLLFGINVKRINHSLLGKSADGIGFDAGFLARITDSEAIVGYKGLGELSAGLTIVDISKTTMTWNTESQREEMIPTDVRFGFAYSNDIPSIKGGIVFSYEYDRRYKGQNNVGLEYQLGKSVAFRLGFRDGDFAAGAGFKIDRYNIDYAFLNYDLASTHRVSILGSF